MRPVNALTLTEFLTARLDEDEAIAQAAIEWSDPEWENESRLGRVWTVENDEDRVINMPALRSPLGPHIARHDPARVLAELEVKRRIVEACPDLPVEGGDDGQRTFLFVQQVLALPYADHPDWREEWRP